MFPCYTKKHVNESTGVVLMNSNITVEGAKVKSKEQKRTIQNEITSTEVKIYNALIHKSCITKYILKLVKGL